MPVSRRGFLNLVGTGRTSPLAGAFMAARGHEEYMAELMEGQGMRRRPELPPGVEPIRISSNENPLGPGPKVIEAILGKFPEANRYPFNSTPLDADLEILIAKQNEAKRDNVVLGAGSQELLRHAVRIFMSPTRFLAEPSPTYGQCQGEARQLGYPVKTVPVAPDTLKTDLAKLAGISKGAGIVYIVNPNNPTGTIIGGKDLTDFIADIRKTSPSSLILVDEAYHDYVTDPSFESMIPTALKTPNVVVARTFSKAYGMAGVRIGYGIGMTETMRDLKKHRMSYNVNTFGVAAALTSLKDPEHIKQEVARNTKVRDFTLKALSSMGYNSTDSQTNFIFVNIGKRMTAAQFREGCAKSGVLVGRDFPPLEKTWARISMGTMEEMQKATDVFRNVLRTVSTTAGQQQ